MARELLKIATTSAGSMKMLMRCANRQQLADRVKAQSTAGGLSWLDEFFPTDDAQFDILKKVVGDDPVHCAIQIRPHANFTATSMNPETKFKYQGEFWHVALPIGEMVVQGRFREGSMIGTAYFDRSLIKRIKEFNTQREEAN